jgi:hypothetical protein
MIAGMSSDISKRAEALATAHPVGEVAENMFLGFFAVLGGLAGYAVLAGSWLLFHSWKFVFVIWLAFSDGFKRAARVPPRQPKPGAAPPVPLPGSVPAPPLMNDGRTHDVYTTPFGVPFGPNVQAWSEPG